MGTIPERATPYRRTSADFDRILSQSWFRLPDVGDDSVNVELNNGRLSFVAQEKVAGTVAVHKSVLSERCSTGSVAEDVESSFLICVTVRVIEAHPMTGHVLQGGLAKMVGQQISGGLTWRSVTAPALGIVPKKLCTILCVKSKRDC